MGSHDLKFYKVFVFNEVCSDLYYNLYKLFDCNVLLYKISFLLLLFFFAESESEDEQKNGE